MNYLRHYVIISSTYFEYFVNTKGFKEMEDPEAIMKAFVEKALSECHVVELLDLIYTLLVLNIEGKE